MGNSRTWDWRREFLLKTLSRVTKSKSLGMRQRLNLLASLVVGSTEIYHQQPSDTISSTLENRITQFLTNVHN